MTQARLLALLFQNRRPHFYGCSNPLYAMSRTWHPPVSFGTSALDDLHCLTQWKACINCYTTLFKEQARRQRSSGVQVQTQSTITNCTIHVSNSRALCIWASLISDWLNLWKRNHRKTKGRRKCAPKLPEWSIRWVKTTKTNTNNPKPKACELRSVIGWRTPSESRAGTVLSGESLWWADI